MKTQKLLLIVGSVCLLAVFVCGSAYAQQPARGIIIDFCEQTANIAEEAVDELDEATSDLNDCSAEFRDCRDGGLISDGDPLIECLSKGNRCTSRATREQTRACDEFRVEFEDAYEDALRSARFHDVEDTVLEFFNTRSRKRFRCLQPAIQVSRQCAGITE